MKAIKSLDNKSIPLFAVLLVVVTAMTRMLPHPPNFTALVAIAVFGTAAFQSNVLRFIVPAVAYFLSDLLVNNVIYAEYNNGFVFLPDYQIYTYATFGIIALLASKTKLFSNGLKGSLVGTFLFFLISNFGVWVGSGMYTANFSGLLSCYVAAIPFYLNSLAGTLFYGTLLWWVYTRVTQRKGSGLIAVPVRK